MQRFYVYLLLKPCGTPFYVGKGCGRRISAHERVARLTNLKSRKLATIRKIWRSGGEVGRKIDSYHDTAESANDREIELISQIGRIDQGRGPLTNATDGGDGIPNLTDEVEAMRAAKSAATRRSEAIRKRNAERTKAWQAANPERAADSIANLHRAAKKFREEFPLLAAANDEKSLRARKSPDAMKRAAEGVKRFYRENPEAKEAKRKQLLSLQTDPEIRQRQQRKSVEALRRPDVLEKMKESRKRFKIENPQNEAARVGKLVAHAKSETNRKRVSAQMKVRWSDPEARARHREAMRKRWADPEYKARVADAIRRKKQQWNADSQPALTNP